MTQINIQEAKTHLSDLIHRSERGEDIIIARAGKPAVRLVPVQELSKRQFGGMTFVVPDDFDSLLPEAELATWE